MSFSTALSGLSAAQTDLGVTGHNIANASTTGFKGSRAEFADIYANSIYDQSSTTPGRGVRVSRVAQQFSQGTVDTTDNALDLAINGNGFFILQDPNGIESYTRNGQFSTDRDGYVVTATGEFVQVFAPMGQTTNTTSAVFNTGATTKLQIPMTSGQPQETGAVSGIVADLNLDARAEVIDTTGITTDPTDPNWFGNDSSQYSSVTSTSIYDSLGVNYTLSYYFIRAGDPADPGASAGAWEVYAYIQGPNDALPTEVPLDSNSMTFGANGQLDPAATNPTAADLSGYIPTSSGGEFGLYDATADTYDNSIPLDFASTTQYGQAFSVNEITQDGYSAGQLAGIDFSADGVVYARFSNGASKVLGQMALADFRNPQGLNQLGDTQWAQSYASGDVKRVAPGTSGVGVVQSGAVESSNVDLATQLVQLIVSQRNYQANAKTIDTENQITQTMINMR